MPYFTEVRTIIIYVENRVRQAHIDGKELEKAVGFSMAHLREIFQQKTGIPLQRYILQRKLVNSTFDLLYSDKRILDIALDYGFASHESYCRAFKRIIGMTPIKYRKVRPLTAKSQIAPGVYGINVHGKSLEGFYFMDEKRMEKGNESTILYGVPRVGYGVYGYTPFPVCLKACSNYLGEDIEYDYSMVSSAAAFRFCWNTKEWDLSNVDIYHTFEETNDVYGLGANALGRKFEILVRNKETTKEEFVQFIKKHIDEGFPCIALGIVGPPEAGIVTGYQKDGEELLGWSFFQNDEDFSGRIHFADNGYYICDNWWENPETQAVMSMGDVIGEKITLEKMVQNGIRALTGRVEGDYKKGIFAYDGWKEAIANDDNFSDQISEGLIHERLMCQHDAMCCLLDGRSNAASYFYHHANEYDGCIEKMYAVAKSFNETFHIVKEIEEILGGYSHSTAALKCFKDGEVRKKICQLIERAKEQDEKALEAMKQLF
ncbi:MAG: helix-turn-helix transcriptional regulator [Lachnospiraceae bacterium]|nr:helix-turn-helix transcriptional regulator [Lachnospiraceae bacterium]